jgi:hypothetical protein
MTNLLSPLYMQFLTDVFSMGGFEADLYDNAIIRQDLRHCFNEQESVEYTVELINFRMGW